MHLFSIAGAQDKHPRLKLISALGVSLHRSKNINSAFANAYT
jgi:hypothetical protein